MVIDVSSFTSNRKTKVMMEKEPEVTVPNLMREKYLKITSPKNIA
jgi:hypothetical protein